MDLVVWNILLTWPWALHWLPICFWVQLLDLILILKVGDGLRPTLTGLWLNLMCAELPSFGESFYSVQLNSTQVIRHFEQHEKNYVLVSSGSEFGEFYYNQSCMSYILFLSSRYLFTCSWLLTIMDFISGLLCSQVLIGLTLSGGTLSGCRKLMLGSGGFIALDTSLSLLWVGESLH